MKITFPYWGSYTIIFTTLFRNIGLEVIPPERTNAKAIEDGAKLSPELFCFPLKVNIGNYIPALKNGVDTIFMWESIGGSCRQRYYWLIQEKILKEAGFNVKFVNFNSRNFFPRVREMAKNNQISSWKTLQALILSFKELRFIDKLEKKAQYFRPRERDQGETDQVLSEIFKNLEKVISLKEFSKFQKKAWQMLAKVELENKEVLKVGLIGEIYTVIDGSINFEIEKKLGKIGIEVHRELSLSHYLLGGLLPWKERQLQLEVNPYLKSTVGGHGRQTIKEILDFVKKDFDGVIHLLPFGCMPEVTIRPILERIHQKSGIPFLSLSLDEQVAEAGINTRIESFVDVVINYHERKKKKNLSWH